MNPRFYEFSWDLSTLKDCLQLLERSMPNLIRAEKERIREEWCTGDDADFNVAVYLVEQLEEGLTTRFLTGAFVVALWAIYETAIRKYAEHIRNSERLTLRLRGVT